MSALIPEVSQGALPVCLLHENPHRLVTLWNMLQVFADTFVKLITELKQAELEVSGIVPIHGSDQQHVERLSRIAGSIRAMDVYCNNLYLTSASKQTAYITEWLTVSSFNIDDFWRMVEQLRRRIQEDLEETVMYSLEPSRVRMFYQKSTNGIMKGHLLRIPPEVLWGDEVCSNFKSAIGDMADASRCLAFGQGTASVFHIMRVMEIGLRALGKSLNNSKLDPKNNPSWDSILKKCDAELAKPYQQKSPEWQKHDVFYGESIANLRAVKVAWRNPTMHVEKSYDYDEALHVWTTSRAFMRQLASHVSE
jgi:hypothetical protein